jgi:hypothetical protein
MKRKAKCGNKIWIPARVIGVGVEDGFGSRVMYTTKCYGTIQHLFEHEFKLRK